MTEPTQETNFGVFTGTITITAEPVTEDHKKALTPDMLLQLAKAGGSVVGVHINGVVDAHGVGRAMGSLLQAFLRRCGDEMNEEYGTVCKVMLPTILGAMLHYAQGEHSQRLGGGALL